MDTREISVFLRQGAIKARNIDELIGICKGVVADDRVCEAEAKYILNWLEANKSVATEFPANVLYPRLVDMLADGALSDDESKELLEMLKAMTGEQGQCARANMSTGIAFDDPMPKLKFAGQELCLTGEFAFGKRKDVEARSAALGADLVKNVVKRGCVVVVGCLGSEAWLHSTHGRKIREAVAARDSGSPVVIVSEEHWHNCCEAAERRLDKEAEKQAELRTRSQQAIRNLVRG